MNFALFFLLWLAAGFLVPLIFAPKRPVPARPRLTLVKK